VTEIEQQIAAFLHEEADRADFSAGMYQRVLRRAKIRRFVTATIAGVGIAAVVLGGVVTAGALRSPSNTGPAGPGESPQPLETHTEGDGPSDPTGSAVAEGVVSGQTWVLHAYESQAGLCVDLELGAGSAGGCGFNVPGKRDLGFSVGSQAGLSKTMVHGVVSKRVTELRAKLKNGRTLDLGIINSPQRFDVNFFVAFLPRNTRGVIEARDDQGEVLQRKPFDSAS
jgi:hypothetical protein